MTLYLKYRPQKIAELDLVEVRQGLTAMLKSDQLPHAWLFTGPWGTGKTSTARIIAKAVNCEKREGVEPCNKCEMCQAIGAGRATDVIEIDAASNRGIEEIRELREKVRLAPMRAKYKVYIIDEVHMLTTEAANALLKTLEEPPGQTLFALCTTEPEKMLETVKSRCAWVKFGKPTVTEAVSSLKHVVEGEKVKADEAALTMIAKAARGSFRDGVKILEQVIMAGGKVDKETTKQVLGWLDQADPDKFIELMTERRGMEALEYVGGLEKQGVNLRGWVERVVERLRELLVSRFGEGKEMGGLWQLVEALEVAYGRLKTTAVPVLPLEMMVMELTGDAGRQVAGEDKGEKKKEKKATQEAKEIKMDEGEEKTRKSAEGAGEVMEEAEVVKMNQVEVRATGRGKYQLEDVEARWTEVMKQVRPKNHSVEALLRSTKPADFDGERLTLEVFYKFHKDKLESEKCRTIVEGAVGEVFGVSPVKLYLRLGEKRGRKMSEGLSGAVDEDIVKAAEEIFKVEAV